MSPSEPEQGRLGIGILVVIKARGVGCVLIDDLVGCGVGVVFVQGT